MREKLKDIQWSQLIVATIAAVTTIIVTFISATYPTQTPTVTPPRDLILLPTEVSVLSTQVASLNQTINSISQLPTDVAVSVQLSQIQSAVEAISKRLEALENALLDNPAKALELPLLKQQMETFQQTQTTSIQNVQNNLNQFIDLGRWLIGLIAASILGLAFNNIFSAQRKTEKKE